MSTPATTQQKADMARALSVVRKELETAEKWAAVTDAGWFITDAQRAGLKAIKDTRSLFSTWSTTWKEWAERGFEKPGLDYPVTHWLRIGGDLASALKTYTGGLYDASVFAIVYNTAKATVADVAALPQQGIDALAEPWSWKTKAVLAGVGFMALLVAGGLVSQSIPGRLARAALGGS